MSKTFIDALKCLEKDGKGWKVMETMHGFLKDALERKLPISEDLLFIVWRWTRETHDGKPLKSSLWKCLSVVLRDVLAIPINPSKWKWFSAQLFSSAVSSYIYFELDLIHALHTFILSI